MRKDINELRQEELIFLREYWGQSIILESGKDISLALELTEKTLAWKLLQLRLAFKDLIKSIKSVYGEKK